jgi:hypothetical protein
MNEPLELPAGFTRRADPSTRSTTMSLHRVRPGRPLGGIVLSHDMIVRLVHYWGKRTIACDGLPHCPACKANQTAQPKGYIAVKDLKNPLITILEIPCLATWAVSDYFDLHRTLRGHVIKLERVGKATNSSVHVSWLPDKFDGDSLPKCPNIIASLCKMWGIKDWQMMIKIFPADNAGDPTNPLPIERQA